MNCIGYRLECDGGCGAKTGYYIATEAAERVAKRDGWEFRSFANIAQLHLCSKCRKKTTEQIESLPPAPERAGDAPPSSKTKDDSDE